MIHCPHCHRPFEYFLRHQVRAPFWRYLFGYRTCIICRACKEIIGYEK